MSNRDTPYTCPRCGKRIKSGHPSHWHGSTLGWSCVPFIPSEGETVEPVEDFDLAGDDGETIKIRIAG